MLLHYLGNVFLVFSVSNILLSSNMWVAMIEKNEWPPNSPDLSPLDSHVQGTVLEKYYKLQPKTKMIGELKVDLQIVWEEVPHQQDAGKLNQALDCLHGCQWWPLRVSAVTVCTSPNLHPHLSTENWLFSEPPTYYWRLLVVDFVAFSLTTALFSEFQVWIGLLSSMVDRI